MYPFVPNGPFGNMMPYSNFHGMNLDWVIQIAKDFLNQYTHIQDIISQGEESIDEHTQQGIDDLDTRYNEILDLLNGWYDTHDEDIQAALAAALNDFAAAAGALAAEVIETIPDDYTALSNLVSDLRSSMLYSMPISDDVNSSDLLPGYYSTVDGSKQTSAPGNYKMIPYLVRGEAYAAYVSNTAQNTRVACFDKSGTYIASVWALTRDTVEKRDFTPAGTCFLGLHSESATSISIHKMDASKLPMVEYPYAGNDVLFWPNYWMNGYGNLQAVDTLSLVCMPNVKPGDKYFVNNNASVNAVFLDRSYNVVESTRQAAGTNGWIVTVPSGAYIGYFNLYNSHLTKAGGHMSGYISKVTGPKVLVIGDSLAWLDGKENWGGMAVYSGFQRQLRKVGYQVDTAAWSGYPYADGLDQVEGTYYSIYTEVVTNQLSVSGYDYVILFGGTNDVLYNGDLGTRPTDYSNRTFDGTTFNGALGAIISYIRTNNPDAKIINCSFPKSEAASRIFTNAVSRVDEIKYNSLFWSCYYLDVFTDMNVQPTYDGFDDYFYDVTHPNYDGSQIIGKLMLRALEYYNK